MGAGERALSDSVPGQYYALPESAATPLWRRSGWVMAIVGAHVLLLLALAYAAIRPEAVQPIRALAVRMLEPEAPVAPKVEPPKPQASQQSMPKKVLTPPPVMASTNSNAPAAFAVAPQPEPVAAPAVAAPAPITAARFDADYLQNPKPVYPPMSRRLGEEGKVVLRVKVSAQGLPVSIEIKQSSGVPRLDDAARSAVERWRFVPAKQGSESVESSVLVPLNFTLSN